ncbi:alpha/beta hydrolase [Streptomyces albus]|uniref:alpha/beta fold hydrolase n=1 Tax=Streptomyces TaxID=1883 RepID=UPI0004BEC497|nr:MULTISPECIES: alpha/beta hydrolase [Streptomyces]QID36861.1 alpha/beta hydrolase [Streptomyces albus]
MVRRIDVTGADGIRLAAWEFADPPKAGQEGLAGPAAPEAPGQGPGAARAAEAQGAEPPGVLLLHGLMGRASHWADTARWLAGRYRAVALDQRGHGRSDKPEDARYDREAYVADAEAALEQLGLAPVALVGHAMGALTAWQLAAKRPDLVQALVISDMRASALGEQSQSEWEQWFASWPVPFATLGDVRKWFGEDDPALERSRPSRGEFFAEVMEEGEDGWRPVFTPRVMLRARETWAQDAHWDELGQVRCPTLVVRGLDGELGRAEAQEMVRVLPRGIYAEVTEAGHLIHYDQPEEWRRVVEPFLQAALPTGH